MAVSRALIERMLHDSGRGLRLIHDLPILTDVWAAFGAAPRARINLLLSPLEGVPPARAARLLAEALRKHHGEGADYSDGPGYVAPLQGLVTATVDLDDLVAVIAPMLGLTLPALTASEAAAVLRRIAEGSPGDRLEEAKDAPDSATRAGALVTLIANSPDTVSEMVDAAGRLEDLPDATLKIAARAGKAAGEPLPRLFRRATLNRAVQRLGSESVRTVKADAARRVFDASCAKLIWAVIDSGIDDTHPAFNEAGPPACCRVWRAYDFSRLRRLTSCDILTDPTSAAYKQLEKDIKKWRKAAPTYTEDDQHDPLQKADLLKLLSDDALHDRPLSWAVVERLLRLPRGTTPIEPHGTHVAGILAGNWQAQDLVGVCPDMRLLDIRIIGQSEEETEAAIIGALEFIRWLNRQNTWRVVHGVNLSIGMKHDVRTWACGQTPICTACEEVVASGVVVVAAAGNDGWQSFLVGDDKRYDGYALASIMDPGNAQSVITVGATHREWPHLYGVSFFSSRGPTGDGRMKPDLLAPGEKIDGPLPNASSGVLDGTSMAAPHVSGVAALLMARHNELQGRPAEIKQILMETAVDLGRERAAQGAGLVDALAALQRR